ncbi:S9 family peptidase [Actinospica durhamensis]|uniref:S9 family peptidase n=1 Tax=Actinospica durhamensis TaxID=1508375 RepID=A0A941EP96_9ACTN|nr:prolyl oligopeptidase family serine peptidase [Actinospica durhamensis]MBR7836030.1 S9 family peptidase [Actinospica durhamensis]
MANTPRGGRWDSPLTAEAVAAAAGGPSWPSVVGAETWWCASDTVDASVRLLRCASPDLSATTADPAHDVLGGPWKVSNGAIGYGGRAYLVVPGADSGDPHVLVFTDGSDHRLYAARVAPLPSGATSAAEPVPLTAPDPDVRTTCYADPILGPDGTEVWCVREVTRTDGGAERDPAEITTRDIVAVPLDGSAADDPDAVRVVARAQHFLTCVRVSPDGARLSWIGWDHPDMPWDTSELMVAELEAGAGGPVAREPVRVLGGPDVSVPQAEWADAATLYAMADPDGWWNLHRVTVDADGSAQAACVLPMESECAHAVWRVGATSFAVTGHGVVFRHGVGDQQLVLWDPAGEGSLTELAPGWTEFAVGVSGGADAVAVVGASSTRRPTPLRVELGTGAVHPCPSSDGSDGSADEFEPWYAKPERRTAPGRDGRTVHFTYHPPTNPQYEGTSGEPSELPPLIIDVHGGPTSTTGAARSLTLSFFTSRGFAVASVDYGGSTGYGRAYRDLLRGTWGVVDVEDSVSVARFLAESGLVDTGRVAVRGGSAGGWTALAALTHSEVFRCGAVYYPIADPFTWYAGQTHDFESRYQYTLLGGGPEEADAFYRRVSPLLAVMQLRAPFVMMHGLDDTICRPDQSERFVAAARALHGEDVCRAYLRFPGEGHGFRHAASLAASLEAELALFTEVLCAQVPA